MSSIYDKSSLVLIPSGTKSGKVFSQKPVNGDGDFTFSRSTAATRVNADGNIEKETQNLLLQSNSFDTTWLGGGLTKTSGQSGYDGSSDAWLIENISSGSRFLTQTGLGSGVATFSIYAKAGTTDWILLNNGLGGYSYFDLTNGIIGASTAIDSQINAVGATGWYRCSIAVSNANEVRYYLAVGNNSPSTAVGDNIYIQDAQLEQGLVARDYIETTTAAVEGGITDNVPRLDYTDSSCPALLLEPQRSNLITNSEYISGWVGANTTPVANTGISPEGVSNATSITFASGGYWYQAINLSYTSGQTFVWSIYVNTSTRVIQWGGATPSGTSTYEIIDAGNGWYRQILTRTTSGSGTSQFQTLMDSVYIGVGVEFKVYGAQLEAGSYATSYIPTYGTSVTRNVDSCSKTGISSLIGQTEGTIYAELNWKGETGGTDLAIWMRTGLTPYNEMIALYIDNSYKAQASVRSSSTQQVLLASDILSDGIIKMAFAYSANDFAFYVNGVLVGTDTSGSIPTCDQVYLGGYPDGGARRGKNKQTLLFKTRLSNEELAALTTI